jgi:hypothetical protein
VRIWRNWNPPAMNVKWDRCARKQAVSQKLNIEWLCAHSLLITMYNPQRIENMFIPKLVHKCLFQHYLYETKCENKPNVNQLVSGQCVLYLLNEYYWAIERTGIYCNMDELWKCCASQAWWDTFVIFALGGEGRKIVSLKPAWAK